MSKEFSTRPINSFGLQMTLILSMLLFIGACSKKDLQANVKSDGANVGMETSKTQPPQPPPANPAIVFIADTIMGFRGTNYIVPCIFVMNADGSHRTLVYMDYVQSGNAMSYGVPFAPKWSGNGQQICFSNRVYFSSGGRPVENYNSIYTMNISVVNGVPTGSNVTRILDGNPVATNYTDPVWSPTANEIAFQARQNGIPGKLQVVPATGGTPSTIYTCPSTDYITSVGPCYNPDGSKLAFELRLANNTTLQMWVTVIDRNSGTVQASVALDTTISWTSNVPQMDWSRTPGSTTLAFVGGPMNSSLTSVYTLNYTTSSTPTQIPNTSYATSPSWSPDDSKIVYSIANIPGVNKGIKIVTLSNNSSTAISNIYSFDTNWKR
jgi:Tol biopolymer transport system component